MQSIRAWLEQNPTRANEVMDKNASYVFFEEQAGPGPRGSSGAVLTPGRSLAVDRDVVPLGVPIWIDTALPGGQPYQRLMVAEDTGGGIQGPVRGDIFFGAGEEAAALAGRMSQPGRWFLLLPRTDRK
jgi:membrane-bound lytic murein transglycosylase A